MNQGGIMAPKKNPRAIGGGSGELIGKALAPRELRAVAQAVLTATDSNADADERKALKRAFAKLRAAHDWQAKNVKTLGL
jgi:hypothetical protein